MEPLKDNYRRRGFDFDLVHRDGPVAMFLQRKKGREVAYEIGYVVKAKEYTMAGVTIPAHETIWGDESVGRTAWTLQGYDYALQRYKQLIKDAQEKASRKEEADEDVTPGDGEEGAGDEGLDTEEVGEAYEEEGQEG